MENMERGSVVKLYLVHCGYYDSEVCDGIYENHINLFVAAATVEEARLKAKQDALFKEKRMHVDGIQEIVAVQGHKIMLQEVPSLNSETLIVSARHRDLATPRPN